MDFASASDKVWMHFAALRLPRTPRATLVQKGILTRVTIVHILIVNISLTLDYILGGRGDGD